MGSLSELSISITMIGLFVLAILGFSIGFASDNSANISVSDDTSSLRTTLNNNMSEVSTGSESTYTSLLETTVEPGSDVIQSSAPFAITPGSLYHVFSDSISMPLKYIFGGAGSPLGFAITILISIILFLFGIYIYKALRGNP